VTCVLCEEQTLLPVLTSTSSFGPPDLDLRPAEPARNSIFAWVQRCGSCAYCAPSIGRATPSTRTVVESSAYRALLGRADLPELARSFLCSSLVFDQGGERAAAARNAIEAAWACDDAGAVAEAARCRLRAVELLRESDAEGDTLFPDPATECVVIVDLLRRARRFEDAVDQVAGVLEADEHVAALLMFSRSLALARDSGRYTVEDALGEGADDEEIVEALRTLAGYGERGDYYAKSVVLSVDDARNYYVQFAVDEGGLYCEVVHNKYLAPEHAFTGDDIAKLLALGFGAPDHEAQNLFRVFQPESDDDYAAIVSLVHTVVTEFFGLPPGHPLQLATSWGERPGSTPSS
jgi:hypothetical protein